MLEESFDARLTVRGDRIVIEGNAVEVQQLTASYASVDEPLRFCMRLTVMSVSGVRISRSCARTEVSQSADQAFPKA